MRLVGVASIIVLVAACGGNDPKAFPNPVGPTSPAPFPAPPTVPTLVLSGIVAEDGHPIENAQVWAYGVQPCSSSGCSFRQFNAGSGTTDAAGRYRISIQRSEDTAATVWAVASKTGYVQQCAATTIMQTDASIDVGLTSLAKVSASRPLSRPGSRSVSGVVFETTPAGRQPVEGASVGWEALFDTVVVETRSDAAGRYWLCGLPLERIGGLYAVKQEYSNVSDVSVGAGTDAVIDIEITRR